MPRSRPVAKKSRSPRLRILSIDGAGLYGLTAAIWLRRLCEAEPTFLDGTDVHLFAGTSSGAVNCLLLARHQRPRDALLAGELEKFWKQPGIFANSSKLSSVASMFGISGWFSSKDFMGPLEAAFGDLKLCDLKQKVFISTFSWMGSEKPAETRAGQYTRHWKPKFWANPDREDPDGRSRVVDVAYAAAAPPVFRPIYLGFSDGAQFNANPSVEAVASVLNFLEMTVQKDGQKVLVPRERDTDEAAVRSDGKAGGLLDHIAVLSMGSGQQLPALGIGTINAGMLFSLIPTNFSTGDFWPTATYSLDAPTESAEFVLKRLLGTSRALRLNPPVMHVPTVMAALLARLPLWRDWLISHIESGTKSAPSDAAIAATLEWIHTPGCWDASAPDLPYDPKGRASAA
ncbi:MAG TPA: patatin-like phospholipase family protein [Myxococcaceae bacterium]|jgi:hypothetical protein